MRRLSILLLALLAAPGTALAAPPPNDNRADAQALESFPAVLGGSTVEATVERLDPQLSQCGPVEATVWYRIDQAPDGRIVVSTQGAGYAPVIRVYRRQTSTIRELDCGSAAAGGRAAASFEAVRGAGYLVLVGKRPGTADAAFELRAELFLPPANDSRRGARVASLPGSIRGTTLGATADELDPEACNLAGATVWYRLRSPAGRRVVLTVAAAGNLDASFGVVEQRRSQTRAIGCGQTGDGGRGGLTYLPRSGSTYFAVVGHQGASDPGTFTLSGVVAQPAERVARQLPGRGVRSSVHYLTDVNDLWRVQLRAGVIYKIGFQAAGESCPAATFRRGTRLLFQIGCAGVRTFTPGPEGGGRYVIEVQAGPVGGVQGYGLRLGAAGPDDLGVGRPLPNGSASRGGLSVAALDVTDLWHFDVARTSDVRLDLRSPGLSLTLLRDDGGRLGSGTTVRRQRRLLALAPDPRHHANGAQVAAGRGRAGAGSLAPAGGHAGRGRYHRAADRPVRPAHRLALPPAGPGARRRVGVLGAAGRGPMARPRAVPRHANSEPEPQRVRPPARRTEGLATVGRGPTGPLPLLASCVGLLRNRPDRRGTKPVLHVAASLAHRARVAPEVGHLGDLAALAGPPPRVRRRGAGDLGAGADDPRAFEHALTLRENEKARDDRSDENDPEHGTPRGDRCSSRPPRSLVRGIREAAAPGLAGGPALRSREEMLERDVEEGAVGLGQQLVAVAQLGRDLDPPAALGDDPGRDPERPVDRGRPPVANGEPRRHGREAVPGRE